MIIKGRYRFFFLNLIPSFIKLNLLNWIEGGGQVSKTDGSLSTTHMKTLALIFNFGILGKRSFI